MRVPLRLPGLPALGLLASALLLSACGTTSGSAGGWGSPRVRPASASAAPTGRRPVPARTPERPPLPPPTDVTRSGLMLPVVGVVPDELRDTFTSPRSGGRTHHAIDIAAPTGTPLVAVADGTVARVSWNALGGRTLYLRSADGRYDYYYAHLDSYAPGMEAGRRVRRGDVVGTVGTSGNARGPHLHFQVLDLRGGGSRGTPVNPYPMLQAAELASAR